MINWKFYKMAYNKLRFKNTGSNTGTNQITKTWARLYFCSHLYSDFDFKLVCCAFVHKLYQVISFIQCNQLSWQMHIPYRTLPLFSLCGFVQPFVCIKGHKFLLWNDTLCFRNHIYFFQCHSTDFFKRNIARDYRGNQLEMQEEGRRLSGDTAKRKTRMEIIKVSYVQHICISFIYSIKVQFLV